MRESILANVVPCDHSLVGCPECRNERAARAQERPRVSNMPATKGTQDMLLMMLDAARQETRDLSAAVGRLGAENKMLREQLAELRTKGRRVRRKK